MSDLVTSTAANVGTGESATTPSPPEARRNLRILLLEDIVTDAELIKLELRRAGIPFSIHCVENKAGFEKALRDFLPDIILSDFSMPGFNAMDALQLLRENDYELPFILVTGSQSEEVAVQCMKLGADDYILKSTLKRLPTALQNALKKKEAERERQRALEELRRREHHFRSLLENALDIIVMLNPDGIFLYAGPSVRVLGYTPEDLLGKNLFDFVSRDDAIEVSELFNAAIQNPGISGTVEFTFRHQDGSYRMLEAICKAMRVDHETQGVVVNARDITERKQSEAHVEKMAAFARLNPNPVLELGAEGQLTYFNDAANDMCRSLGMTHPSEILPSDTRAVVKECLTTGQSNLHRETSVGNRILAWSYFPIIPSQVVHCYAVDITERLSLEAQLRQSQKMDSIGQLAAGVAHDFNNILTVIQGYTGLMLARENLSADDAEPLQQMAAAVERASNLTRQLLTFSRKQIMQPQDLDLNEVISNVAKLLGRILGEDIALHFNYSPGVPHILADPGMMEQIILNLAVNARDAMPRGGHLTISAVLAEINHAHAKANPEATPGTYVCVRVTDSGSGIPKQIMPRIFEPFFTTKDVGKGTGLGLATVYGIVKQHRGWVEVLSEVGRGTTFRIYLPASREQIPAAPTETAVTEVRGGTEKVLVVEDEPDVQALVRDILKSYGYTVFLANSGREALPIWKQHRDEIDLLLTDMVMPGNMSGRELGDLFKADKPDLKVIYTTGYSVDMIGRDFNLKRGLNFLQKPYHPMTLVKVVRDCLDSAEV